MKPEAAMKNQTIQMIEQEKIIAIVRGIDKEQCKKVADALYEGGIRLMEVTFDQKNPASFQTTASAIQEISQAYAGRMLVGAGTVTTPELVELAAQAGGKFIISPDVNVDVIHKTCELGLVSMPGAMTPTEILTAHRAGADFVKLFPASELGTSYVKAVRAPISHVKLMAVGGINENNVADFLRAGMCGAGIGGNLANKKWIEAGEFSKITETARALVQAVKEVNG
jgi:2-dehydro-3-deoxyphosphogluconate aldolase/(4S)-4-hydroxy-2-oxoglutarate aldolase